MNGSIPDTAYAERLHVPVSWWLLGTAFVVSVGWAFLVAVPGPVTVAATIIAAALVAWWLVSYGRLQMRVDAEALYAGRAVLPRGNVGAVQVLDAAATRRAMGAEADARAFLATRPYCRAAVRVEVVDRTDPTPYWLLSSRNPSALAASLGGPAVRE